MGYTSDGLKMVGGRLKTALNPLWWWKSHADFMTLLYIICCFFFSEVDNPNRYGTGVFFGSSIIIIICCCVFSLLQKFPSPNHWVTASGWKWRFPPRCRYVEKNAHRPWIRWWAEVGVIRYEVGGFQGGMEAKKASMGLVDLLTFAIPFLP